MSRAERVIEVRNGTRPVTLASHQTLPLSSEVQDLFPATGLRRGSTVVVSAAAASTPPQGVTTLAFALAVASSTAGSWCAAVGFPDLGLVAVDELGLSLDRLALVPRPTPNQWVAVVGALVDAVDILIVRPPAHLRQGDARRLTSRTRERGAVLIPVLDRRGPWMEGADVRLAVAGARWRGTGTGDGHLLGRRLEVIAGGRGAAARERRVDVYLPALDSVPLAAPGASELRTAG